MRDTLSSNICHDQASISYEHFSQEHCCGGIVNLISQPTPSLRCLTLQQNKINFHAFPDAPNLKELNVIYS